MIAFDILAGLACTYMSVTQFAAHSSFWFWGFGAAAFVCFVGALHEMGVM